MRILLLAYHFPPYNSIGAIRIGKLAKFLAGRGHEVRVLAARSPLPKDLALEIDPAAVTYTRWLNVNFLPEMAFGGKQQVRSKGYTTQSSLLKNLGFYYRVLLNLPDERIGWYPFAAAAGTKLARAWKPDLIYASMPPATTLMAAARISRASGAPWVAELRDLWVDNATYVYPGWRRRLESRMEAATLGSAAGIVTVSQPWAERLRAKYGLPTAVAMNGYAPEDIPDPAEAGPPEPGALRVVYTGTVYPHSQDPGPLFAALRRLGEDGKRVRAVFYSRYIDAARSAAEREGAGWAVEHCPLVPYRESLRIQQEADVLLYLIPNQQGFVPAKLFEYLAARRPVLALGESDSVAGRLVSEREAGLVSAHPEQIAAWLKLKLEAKLRDGCLPALPEGAPRGLSRDEQFAALEQFLLSLPLSRAR